MAVESNAWVDELIDKLLNSQDEKYDKPCLEADEIDKLFKESTKIFQNQTVLLEIKSTITIVGDLQGQFFDLLRIFERCGDPKKTNYLFLGNYVENGKRSMTTLCLLLAYKIKYPENFFMIRGNYEVPMEGTFCKECEEIYGNKQLWEGANEVFDWLPLAALINGKILCVHSGISPGFKGYKDIKKIERPAKIPGNGLIRDLLYGEPDKNTKKFNTDSENIKFGLKQVEKLLKHTEAQLLIRSNQKVENGVEFPFDDNQKILTIFSAPNHNNSNNKSAVIHVNTENVVTFSHFEQDPEDNELN